MNINTIYLIENIFFSLKKWKVSKDNFSFSGSSINDISLYHYLNQKKAWIHRRKVLASLSSESLPNVSASKLFTTHRAHKRLQIRVTCYVRLQGIISVEHFVTHVTLEWLFSTVHNTLVITHRAWWGKNLIFKMFIKLPMHIRY